MERKWDLLASPGVGGVSSVSRVASLQSVSSWSNGEHMAQKKLAKPEDQLFAWDLLPTAPPRKKAEEGVSLCHLDLDDEVMLTVLGCRLTY